MFHVASRALQDRFDSRRLADRIVERLASDTIDDSAREFISRADMFFLASADAEGRPQCSYKGGDPGFVRIVDPHSIAFPSYDGNGMFLTLGNIGVNPNVGLLFIDFERPYRIRLNGTASVELDDPLLAEYPEAQLIVRVRIRELFPNCGRYIHTMKLVERSSFVPRVKRKTPVPDWKRADWAVDVLPTGTDLDQPN